MPQLSYRSCLTQRLTSEIGCSHSTHRYTTGSRGLGVGSPCLAWASSLPGSRRWLPATAVCSCAMVRCNGRRSWLMANCRHSRRVRPSFEAGGRCPWNPRRGRKTTNYQRNRSSWCATRWHGSSCTFPPFTKPWAWMRKPLAFGVYPTTTPIYNSSIMGFANYSPPSINVTPISVNPLQIKC